MSGPVRVHDLAARHARTYGDHVERYAEVNADRAFAAPLLDRLASHLAPGALVVDLGCGPGWETEALERCGFRAVGLDVTPEFVRLAARAHPASGYVVADFLALPFRDGALDGAWACSSLVHVPWAAIDDVLGEIARVLRPGGAFLATMQAGSSEGAVVSTSVPGRLHYAYYEPDAWRARLQRVGFEVTWMSEHASASEHCNPGARGWIESLALRRRVGN